MKHHPSASTPKWNIFDYVDTRNEERSLQRIKQQRRVVVTRSIIGQQPDLSASAEFSGQNFASTAPPNRERGPRVVAENINVVTSSVTENNFSTRAPSTQFLLDRMSIDRLFHG